MRMTEAEFKRKYGVDPPPATSALLNIEGYGGTENRGSQQGGSKHNNVWTEVDGIKFQSKHEARRYELLRDRQLAKEISDLKCQVRYRIMDGEKYLTTYVADFTYRENGELVVEDAKGRRESRDPSYNLFKLKKRLLLLYSGLDIREV